VSGKSRRKGVEEERRNVRLLKALGFDAHRIARPYTPGADLSVRVGDADLLVECKLRASGFSTLYKFLEGRDLLVVRSDRREPLLVLPLKLAAKIAGGA
jgi:Holliday junction resolvase